jgi:hypothetical protein
MAMDEDWEQLAKAPAITGIDEHGRMVVQGEAEFTCPECGTEFEVQITLPLDAGESDGQT